MLRSVVFQKVSELSRPNLLMIQIGKPLTPNNRKSKLVVIRLNKFIRNSNMNCLCPFCKS